MNASAAIAPLRALVDDVRAVARAKKAAGSSRPRLAALGDTSTWALTLLRTSAALRSSVGTSLGMSTALRLVFHIDVWSDEIGPGLRLPHPFNIVIGEGVSVGRDCVLMHNVTIQRGAGTVVEDRSVLGTGSVVLAGAHVGSQSIVGAASVVHGDVPKQSVMAGVPARRLRSVRPGETP